MKLRMWGCTLVFSFIFINLIAQTSHAQQFSSLSDCRKHFQTSVQAGSTDVAAMDKWCESHMSALAFCTDQALLRNMQSNSYTSAQIPTVRAGLERNCQAALSASGTGGASVTAAVNGAPVPPTPPTMVQCAPSDTLCLSRNQGAQADYQTKYTQYMAAKQNYERDVEAKKAAAAKEQAAQQQQQTQRNIQAAQQVNGIIGQAIGSIPQGGSGAPTSAPPSQTAAPPPQQSANQPQQAAAPPEQAAAPPGGGGGSGEMGPPDPKQFASDVKDLEKMSDNFGQRFPETAGPADALKKAPTSPGDVQQQSEISSMGNKTLEQLIAEVEKAVSTFETANTSKSTVSLRFSNTPIATKSMVTELQGKYKAAKQACIQAAERTDMLCLEGKSPGIKAAKLLMDISGPVLAALSAAQSQCSGAGQATDLANKGITIAKGVCVAAKVMCDSTCGKAIADLKSTLSSHQTRIQNAAKMDGQLGADDCLLKYGTPYTASQLATCKAEVTAKYAAAGTASGAMSTAVNKELATQPGTTPSIVAKCGSYGKDILSMTTNILGLAMASQKAKECAAKLAAAAGPDGQASVAEVKDYCNKPEAKGTQFCQCQGNMTAAGCPGHVVGVKAVDPAADTAGTNLKSGSGLSSFAGGPGSRGGTKSDFGINRNNGGDSDAARTALTLGGFYPQGGPGSAAGAAGGSGGSASGSAGTADGKNGGGPGGDAKKWGFGSFAGSSGGGPAGGSGRGGGAGGNGQLNAQQEEAIERKIASERLAAEVTSSSGIDNFSKIKKSYTQKSDTFMLNP